MHSTNGLQVFLNMMYSSCNFRGKCGEEGNFRGQDIKNLCKKIDFTVFTDSLSFHALMGQCFIMKIQTSFMFK